MGGDLRVPSSAKQSLLDDGRIILALYVLVTLALKATSFGDPDRHVDETFYFLIGQRMHEGLLPYVDVWDRKPLGLFLIYYLIAGVSSSVWAYQIAACLFAVATAFVIWRMATRWCGPIGGLYAGLTYLVMLPTFEGASGQAPDFYNLLVAGAACLVAGEFGALDRGKPRWPIAVAMLLCGLAIAVKQTALFESLFLGLWVQGTLWRAGVAKPRLVSLALACALLGALPTLAIAVFYWQAGHWPEFWHAMVLSNLAKAPVGGEAWRLLSITLIAVFLLVYAVAGLLWGRAEPRVRAFLTAWIVAAAVGFLSVPNFFGHYMLPLLVPLSVAAGLLFARMAMRRVLFAALTLYALTWQPPVSFAWTRDSQQAMERMAAAIRRHDPGGGLLVFDGPPYLYALTGERFLSPLVFPPHWNQKIERDVSHLRTQAEIERVLAARPGVIVIARDPVSGPINRTARDAVLRYAARQCRSVLWVTGAVKRREEPILIFGDCGVKKPA